MVTNFSPGAGLLPDFVVNTNTAPAPAGGKFLESVTDGQYGYNSCRVPWRIGTDYLVNGDPRAKLPLDLITNFIRTKTGDNPALIVDGYALDGGPAARAWGESFAFTGPFGVAAMADAKNQAWL